ncbi:hypothetical protein LguiB_006989 [Lonicera macranthoides]
MKSLEVSRLIRDVQPAHYICKIESFSILVESGMERYESDDFEASGYKWKLCLYPNGNKKRNGENHISLYLAISDTTALPQGWEVNAQFKLFVYDRILDKYLTIQDAGGKIRRFYGMKTEWGFDQLIPLDIFKNESNGYLIEDNCAFGAEVFVTKYAGKGQCLSMIKESKENTYAWKIDNFSTTNESSLIPEEFEAGGRKWKLWLYPKRDIKGKGRSLSLYLELADYATLPPKWRVYAKYKLRMRDQLQSNHFERGVSTWFGDSIKSRGFHSFMLLSDLNDTSKGFIVNNTIIVEAEISITATIKNFT